ncbi:MULTISPECIES: leucine-rich repeat protein [unclassified Ruminococcus]|uniref:leucine-rich repeat protein n=1 Tax=unclassified Ruminococcus TaxID=2608920 RepID=UPI00210EEE4F|nr:MULTISPECIES: leucine-rich repeat protein [unclassified Ruminococcus]MCQ4022891.1 leucine-rich repeat protein [Ruminococcus sp. zg-924]MCQ4115293.1 leucine-rich repeat protein [Ruminococcus sp. zg-921]
MKNTRKYKSRITSSFKAIVSFALAFALMLSLAVFPTAAAENFGDYKYEIYDDTVIITDYTGSDAEITIPSEIGGKSVTSIGDYAFDSCDSLQSVTIPNSVTSIGAYAFCNSLELTSITIPDGVISIGESAFSLCFALQSITIPNSVTSIGDGAFEYCHSLQSVTIPDSVTSIGAWTFYNCNDLTSVTIPDSVTSIGDSAFEDCTSLKSITIPNSVTSIGAWAFGYYFVPDSGDLKFDDFTIYGYADTAAEDYAINNGFKFVSLTLPDVPGDVTGDGKVTLTDSINIQKAALQIKELTGQALINADLNKDGKVSVIDAIKAQIVALQMAV